MGPLRNVPRLAELSSHLLRLPTTDRGTFTALTSIPNIQAWTIAKADEYRHFALALLAIHNLAAPIHRLPTEVLERVFSNCWQDWNSLRLPHVCRLWRSILLDRPEFWADAVAKCELQEKRDMRSELPLIDSLLSRSTQYSHTIEPNFYIFSPAIAQLVAPHSSSITSLHVTAGSIDLQDGLWPALVSGMHNLETLTIQLAITEVDLRRYRTMTNAESDYFFLRHYHSPAWSKLSMLSRDALPNLSRLTCPHGMVGRFANVPLRHLKAQIEVMNRSQHSQVECCLPTVVLGRPQGLHLKPHRRRLETLEIMPIGHVDNEDEDEDEEPSESLEFFSLRHLRIEVDSDVVSHILSWIELPQAAFVHIPKLYTGAYSHDLGTELHPIVDPVDRACLQQLTSSSYLGRTPGYRTQCFSGGVERLRIDDLRTDPSTLISIFGEDAPVTHLELSVVDPYLVMNKFDLCAFPHLTHLDVSGSNVRPIGCLLQPALHTRRPFGWGFADSDSDDSNSTLPSLKLAELVISCTALDSMYMRRLDGDTDFGTEVDELFCEQFGVFKQALMDRAARGTRLTYLALSLHPATPDDICSTEASEAQAIELEAGAGDQEQARPKEPALKPCAVWPSHTVRRTVLESLRELVDGPVILKLLDDAGEEINVEED